MKKGHLSAHFRGVAAKFLSAVEVNLFLSNQHEFNGVAGLKQLLGIPHGKVKYDTRFIYLNDDDPEPIVEDAYLTWYDSREETPNRTEYRLYFPDTSATKCATEGDLLVIGLRQDDTLLAIIAEGGSTIASQIAWLFGLSDISHPGFSVREEMESGQDRIAFASRFILESIGIVDEPNEPTFLDEMLEKFSNGFPTTKEFSSYSRSTLSDMHAHDGPDEVLLAWMEREEVLFRTLERYLIAERLTQGFEGDVEGFISYSLSVQNRRKSRAGSALELHLATIFDQLDIRYVRGAKTEKGEKPDFLFPGIDEYMDGAFPNENLTMLGAKSTCKDRWRQVLAEAERIEYKHLLTLEAAISEKQTDNMALSKLQLVVPKGLQSSYTQKQQAKLMNLAGFCNLALNRQRK